MKYGLSKEVYEKIKKVIEDNNRVLNEIKILLERR
mgnify:CR=1 FL=1